MSPRARLALVIALAVTGGAIAALIAELDVGERAPDPADIEVSWRDGLPVVTVPPEATRDPDAIVRLPDVERTYAENVLVRIRLGGEQRLLTRVEAFARGGSEPVAAWDRACVVVRDAWLGELRYHVDGGPTERVDDSDLFLARCVGVSGVVLERRDEGLRSGAELELLVTRQLNPPHAGTTMESTRRWLRNPDDDGSPNTFYGQLVGIFVFGLGQDPELSSPLRASARVRVP